MIFFLAAVAIAVLVSIVLFMKFGATPSQDAIKNLDIPMENRPAPKPIKNKLPEREANPRASSYPSMSSNIDAAASKALNDLMNQYMPPDSSMYRSSSHNLTMADKMRLLEDYQNEKYAEPDLTEDELEQKIAALEEELMDIEDTYASVQADAEVTGDRRELDKVDERYGDLEESINKYKDQLANYGKRQQENAEIMNKMLRDLGLGDNPMGDLWIDKDDGSYPF